MKSFIYKTIIALIAFFIFFEFTIGSRLDYYSDKLDNLADQQKKIEFKQKILKEMKKGSEKEKIFSEEERIIISNYLKKVLNELDLTKN